MAENGVRPPDRQPDGHQEDVFLDVPKLEVEKVAVDVANLRARVSLNAHVLNLLHLDVGVDAAIDQVHLEIEGVEAAAQLRVRLENVAHMIERVLDTVDDHPEIIGPLVENAGTAVGRLGSGAGEATREVGYGAGEATREIGGGAAHATREIAGDVGQFSDAVGEGAGDATRSVGGVAEQAGQAGKQVTEHAAEADLGAVDQPDISARATVAADRAPRRNRGLPRRKPREW
ncbi:hypothetical protein [Asanoa iriomotensis]|uniref:Uncharacterized protein n=1 Tax=Asanoa iriomotensis TaxID=234613 RepID=A0ABQ4CC36_9ACTN|nr:hypothetical protein [Asanoa iriomotensis]GIF60328.1 hypothetical protein Air01nite_64230 [Asanoa iriomotensis]